jgi:hypothetical protein
MTGRVGKHKLQPDQSDLMCQVKASLYCCWNFVCWDFFLKPKISNRPVGNSFWNQETQTEPHLFIKFAQRFYDFAMPGKAYRPGWHSPKPNQLGFLCQLPPGVGTIAVPKFCLALDYK